MIIEYNIFNYMFLTILLSTPILTRGDSPDNVLYIPPMDSWYRYHNTETYWQNAIDICSSEGGQLFYPQYGSEILDLERTFDIFKSKGAIWVAASNLQNNNQIKTVDGIYVSDLFHSWSDNEPNTGGGRHCVAVHSDRRLRLDRCSDLFSFVCIYSFDITATNYTTTQKPIYTTDGLPIAERPPPDYTYIEQTNSWYKVHSKTTWRNAVDQCSSEGGKLFYPEDGDEARAVGAQLDIFNDDDRVWIGVSNLESREYKTVDDRSIDDIYNHWRSGEPSSFDDYHCVTIKSTYELWVGECTGSTYKFVCKYTPKQQSTDQPEATETTTTPDVVDEMEVITKDSSQVAVTSPQESEVAIESRSHLNFGRLVGEEVGRFPPKGRLQVMVSILQVLQEHRSTQHESCDNQIQSIPQ